MNISLSYTVVKIFTSGGDLLFTAAMMVPYVQLLMHNAEIPKI